MREEKAVRVRVMESKTTSAGTSARQDEIREITWRYAGIVRNAEGLKTGLKRLSRFKGDSNLITVSRMIHESALAREESRGAHYREDFPQTGTTPVHSCVKKGHETKLA
jgi:aspartate oxidase